METVTLNTIQDKVKKILDLTQEELARSSIRSLLRDKLRAINIDRIATCRKYNISSIEELDILIREGKVNELLVDEDFQHIDYLTWKTTEIKSLLIEIE